jgi:hypothetical protein
VFLVFDQNRSKIKTAKVALTLIYDFSWNSRFVVKKCKWNVEFVFFINLQKEVCFKLKRTGIAHQMVLMNLTP